MKKVFKGDLAMRFSALILAAAMGVSPAYADTLQEAMRDAENSNPIARSTARAARRDA